jgi:hypothetical protein
MMSTSSTGFCLGIFFHKINYNIRERFHSSNKSNGRSGDEMFAASPQTEVNLESLIASGGESESS